MPSVGGLKLKAANKTPIIIVKISAEFSENFVLNLLLSSNFFCVITVISTPI